MLRWTFCHLQGCHRGTGDLQALRRLLLYNAEDVRNLAHIRRKFGVS